MHSFHMDSFATQLVSLKQAHLRAAAFARARLAPLGLTPARWALLRTIDRHPGACRQSDVARALSVSPAAVSKLLGPLVRAGLVVRRRDLSDWRQRLLRLTACGADLAQRGHSALLGAAPAHPPPDQSSQGSSERTPAYSTRPSGGRRSPTRPGSMCTSSALSAPA